MIRQSTDMIQVQETTAFIQQFFFPNTYTLELHRVLHLTIRIFLLFVFTLPMIYSCNSISGYLLDQGP